MCRSAASGYGLWRRAGFGKPMSTCEDALAAGFDEIKAGLYCPDSSKIML
jgi:hypothetical protein